MQSTAVVKHGDIVQYILLGFITSLVVSPLYPLLLQAAEEAFSYGIIPTIPFSAHAAIETMSVKQLPKSDVV
jgi:hypothetical protein